ncbi:unnamed protein product [Caenorhabditis brenneri]
MVGKLILISVWIVFIIGFLDPETKNSSEQYNKINQEARSSDLKSAFAGEEFWEDVDQQLCDDPEFDETWMKPESLCYSVIRGYEETRIEILTSSPSLVISRKAKNSDLKFDFAGEEFWEDVDQQLCNDPEFDETWKKPESLCYSVVRGYEETRIEVLSSRPPLVIYRGFFTKKQVDDYSKIFKKRNLEKQTVVSQDGTQL